MKRKSRCNFLLRTFRAALRGDIHSAKFLIDTATLALERNQILTPGLRKFLVRQLRDPDRLHQILTFKPLKKRGRPSTDDGSIHVFSGLKTGRIFFGKKKTEKLALIIQYLVSQGHPINESGSHEKESAVQILSDLTGLSPRSLQSYYYRNRSHLRNTDSQLELGRAYLVAKKKLKEISATSRGHCRTK